MLNDFPQKSKMEGDKRGGNNLKRELTDLEVETIVPTGCFLSSCVYLTGQSALEKKFNVGIDLETNLALGTDIDVGAAAKKQVFEITKRLFESSKAMNPDALTMITRESETMRTCLTQP